MNGEYFGRINPNDENWKHSPWVELLKERYYIVSLFCEGKNVLDSCCGTGWGTMQYIVPKSKFTVGFDINDSAVKAYGVSDNYHFTVMDGKSLALDDNAFDLVLSLDTIEHFHREDGIKYLNELKRVCKEDGLIIGTTPLVIDVALAPIFLSYNKYHLCMYAHTQLYELLKKHFFYFNIYEVYNKICPYFLFICGKTEKSMEVNSDENLEGFFQDKRKEHRRTKIYYYLSWSNQLFLRRIFIKSARLFFSALFLKVFNIWQK